MAQHSLRPTCRYYESESERAVEGPPKVKAQFFYISSVPIDDPLSPVPPAASEKASAKHPAQPFSSRDNAALEEAWQGFQSIVEPAKDAKLPRAKTQRMVSFPKFTSGSKGDISEHPNAPHSNSKTPQEPVKKEASPQEAALQKPYDKLPKPPGTNSQDDLQAKRSPSTEKLKSHEDGNSLGVEDRNTSSNGRSLTEQLDHKETVASKLKNIKDKEVPTSFPDEPKVASSVNQAEQGKSPSPLGKPSRKKNWFSSDASQSGLMLSQDTKADIQASAPVEPEELLRAERDPSPKRSKSRRNLSPFRHLHSNRSKESRQDFQTGQDEEESLYTKHKHRSKHHDAGKIQGHTTVDSDHSSAAHSGQDTSTISGRPFARAPSRRNLSKNAMDGSADPDPDPYGEESEEPFHPPHSKFHLAFHPHPKAEESKKRAFVPVGVSRLHLVEMPDLVMKPIYWSPINDQASVIRATWFYKDTMEPVDAELANRLEAGYEDMKPYSDVYKHELDSCVEHGASAELKVVHRLWPEAKPSRPPTATNMEENGTEDKSPQLTSDVNAAADHREPASSEPYATHSVIYVDKKNAQILKPSLLPNELRGRTPLGSIRRGRAIGVPIVRGFDLKIWEKGHPKKMNEKAAAAKVGGYISQSGDATTRDNRPSCPVCDAEEVRPRPLHLVLVIHGIGQKLSERVDSYHFTHAINGLRREFNVELASADVKSTLHDSSGIMVLPVNWRLNLSFDEQVKAKWTATENKYGLADITPDTLPAVRSLISDVMLDIPYYLSHHKEKMMSSVVKEANRVYRLWCRNNPGFQENGKVHLVAHSLGSVMAMDILSEQPTNVPKNLDLSSTQPVSESMFEFDTKSLFCCGSPSGFFLLLNNASLIPRKGRKEDSALGITGEAGTYGCLAVDNVYNICHKNDPIAYLQNSCVDRAYSASLTPANIPSANMGMLSKIGSALRITSGTVSNAYDGTTGSQRPAMVQLPSTVELETHNFSREEIAERRMYLLNDNGQIDFFLNSAGGPLEFQYLNMLSAHSSYWILQDFVRFLVVEIGRQPGKSKTLPSLRAQKRRDYKRGEMK